MILFTETLTVCRIERLDNAARIVVSATQSGFSKAEPTLTFPVNEASAMHVEIGSIVRHTVELLPPP